MSNYTVVPAFPVKGFRFDDTILCSKDNKEDIISFNRSYKDRIIGTKMFGDGLLKILAVDKITPHSLYDLMLIDGGVHYQYSIYDYPDSIVNDYWHLVASFVGRVNLYDSEYGESAINLCYNYDPYTRDRASIMSEKRFHTHLIRYSGSDVSLANTLSLKDDDIDLVLRRRLIDPYYEVCCEILSDSLKNNGIDYAMQINYERDKTQFLPLGVKIIIDDNWLDFLITVMPKIHDIIITTYSLLFKIVCRGSNGLWQRAPVNDDDRIWAQLQNITWINNSTKDKLMLLLSQEKKEIDINSFRNDRKKAIENIPLAGPAYSFSCFFNRLFDQNRHNIISIYPKIFSDMGGAGVTWLGNNNVVRIKREVGYFTEKENKSRNEFHRILTDKLLDH